MALRLVRPRSPAATCSADEVMISAFCSGNVRRHRLIATENGARCGPDRKDNSAEVSIVCAKL